MISMRFLDEGSPRVESPFGDRVHLFPHQLAVSRSMRDLESGNIPGIFVPDAPPDASYYARTTFGVVGDTVGAGKSYSVLCTIASKPCLDTADYLPHRTVTYGSMHMNIQRVGCEKILPINIIVVPHGGVFAQWRRYIETAGMQEGCILVSKKCEMEEVILKIDNGSFARDEEPKLILVSSTFYNVFATTVWPPDLHVSRVIYDEADTIRIPNCREIPSKFTWFVTSSTNNLESPQGAYQCDGIRHQGFIKNIFRFIERVQERGFIFIKCTDTFVQSSLNIPPIIDLETICKPTPGSGIIRGMCSAEVSSMLDAGDIAGAIGRIGCPSAVNTTSLLDIISNQLRVKIANEYNGIGYLQGIQGGDPRSRQVRINRHRENIGHLEAQVATIANRLTHANEHDCPICSNVAGTGSTVAAMKCCAQLFCLNCIQTSYIRYNNHKCPMCNTPFNLSTDVVAIHSQSTSSATSPPSFPTKLEKTLSIIHENPDGRFLIFSGWDATFANISQQLTFTGVTFAKLSGNANQINSALRKFNSREVRVLFLHSGFFGQGYNLEQTTDVIIYHKMRPEATTQIIGRAHRYGRTLPLKVHRLLHPGETQMEV